jgi:hypothetical protein
MVEDGEPTLHGPLATKGRSSVRPWPLDDHPLLVGRQCPNHLVVDADNLEHLLSVNFPSGRKETIYDSPSSMFAAMPTSGP